MATDLATLPAPAAADDLANDISVHAIADIGIRLDDLTRNLDSEPDDLAEVIAMRDQAHVIAEYVRNVRDARDLEVHAAECRLRAERRCGQLLMGLTRTNRWKPRKGAVPKLAPGTLATYGLNAHESTQLQAIGRMDAQTFEAELTRRRERQQPASRLAMLKLAGPLRPRRTKITPTALLLRSALQRLERVTTLTTAEESALAQRVLVITARWGIGVTTDAA